jgi:predicted nicotinamide N-methyase
MYATPNATPPIGYQTKQESIAVKGVANILIRSLLDKQQFHDPFDEALHQGISSAAWPLFGLLWPSGLHLAERLAQRPVQSGERILEVGCGLALASLVGHRRGADVTASDCHPLAAGFMLENLRINHLLPLQYRHGRWGTLPVMPAAMINTHQALTDDKPPTRLGIASALTGRFDLIMGSDILYERDEAGTLPAFIEEHAAHACEVWVVDPNRGNRAHFHRHMGALGFVLKEYALTLAATPAWGAYKGRMLSYQRHYKQ